ncbi:MAG TPA: thiamine pyrophosphate-binding protein [Stellaceae bacterium]|nr:thiamine pyrophosphate-binding protein [Stellaceae bacterium]
MERHEGDGTNRVGWQSDVIADLVRRFGFPYIALNPGASYRGLHDSLVNHNGNQPPMLLCQHEKIAVQIAHGYAKATGRPMVAIVHDVVGLLHATMGIYYAYIDRAPIFVIGATGPMDESKRRPFIDWIHTANVQGEAVRNFVKWDYQPASVEGVPDSFARAYSIMMSEPQGPIYMCYDAWLQEAPLAASVALPSGPAVPTAIAPDPAALEQAAERLLAAKFPVLLPEYVGRAANGFNDMVALAETVGAPVHDVNGRLNFPNRHPLNLTWEPAAFRDADLILGLDLRDWEKPTHGRIRGAERTKRPLFAPSCEWMEIGFGDIAVSKWSMDYQRIPECSLRVLADTALAIPALTQLCRERIAGDKALAARIAERTRRIGGMHDAMHARLREDARKNWDALPMTPARLAHEVWEVIRHEDWVLTAGTLNEWARKLWDFDRPYRHPGRYLGTGTQIGMSLGVALAHKDQGRLVVDLQPDGDLMFDAGALWIAARYRIPMLVVMYNNRAYMNDWEHQIHVSEHRGTPVERAHVGQDIVDPAPDFAGLARSMGWFAEGPIERPQDVPAALARAIAEVKQGRPALVDTVVARGR